MSLYSPKSLICSLAAVAAIGCNASVDSEADTSQPLRHEAHLSRIVDTLSESGCTSADATLRIKTALQSNGRRARRVIRRTLRNERSVCNAGAELIRAVMRSRTAPLFEGQRIIFDADGDRCMDSVFDGPTLTASMFDADGDGCFDRIWEAEGLIAELDIDEGVAADLSMGAQTVTQHLFEPPVELRDRGYDWIDHRMQAEPELDLLMQRVLDARIDPTSAGVLIDFLDNTRELVAGFSGCRDMPEGPAAPLPTSDEVEADGEFAATSNGLRLNDTSPAAPQKYFYLNTNRAHSWVSLEQGDEKHGRGFYKGGYGGGKKAGKVPKASELDGAGGSAGGTNGGNSSSGSSSSSGATADSSAGSGSGTFNGKGYISNDTNQTWFYRACYQITDAQWDKAVKRINNNIDTTPEYRFFSRNCLGWSVSIADLLGKTVPDHTYLGVPDPDTFSDTLKGLADSGKTGGADKVESSGGE